MEHLILLLIISILFPICAAFNSPRFNSVKISGSISTRLKAIIGGRHGDKFKYLPIARGNPEEPFPRIVHIAGVYPQISPDMVMAPMSPPAAELGCWSYDFPDANGPQLGSVAIPGSDVIAETIDPIALIASSDTLGINLPEVAECVVVIDRADLAFSSDKFYLFRMPDNSVSIQWMNKLEHGCDILGRVVLTLTPFLKSMEAKKTGFLEEDDG